MEKREIFISPGAVCPIDVRDFSLLISMYDLRIPPETDEEIVTRTRAYIALAALRAKGVYESVYSRRELKRIRGHPSGYPHIKLYSLSMSAEAYDEIVVNFTGSSSEGECTSEGVIADTKPEGAIVWIVDYLGNVRTAFSGLSTESPFVIPGVHPMGMMLCVICPAGIEVASVTARCLFGVTFCGE